MPTYTDSTPVTSSVPSAYATVNEADSFLNKRIRLEKWKESSSQDKENALIEATSWIDRLNFAGDKADADQELEFPRGTDTVVPEDIKRACILCAKEIIDGRSPERVIDSQSLTSEGSINTRNQFNRWYSLSYNRAGIASAEAWGYLQPYLRDPQEMSFSRIN